MGIETVGQARTDAGLDPDGIELGTYVNAVAHPDVEVARALAAGNLSTFARFSVMHGTVTGPTDDAQRAVLEALHDRYDMRRHTSAASDQAATLTPDFVDRYAIVGPPEHCVERLQAIADLGITKAVVIGPSAGADRQQARVADDLMVAEVLPAFAADR